MTRDINSKLEKTIYIVEHTQYGVGMSIQLLPVLLYIQSLGNEVYLKTMKEHVELIELFIDREYLYPYKKGMPEKNRWVSDPVWANPGPDVSTVNSSIEGSEGPYASHAVDYYFRKFCSDMHDKVIPMELKNYPRFPANKIDLSKFNLPEKYIVISPTSTKEGCKINEDVQLSIIQYLKNKGHNIVFVGAEYPMFLGDDQKIDASRKLTMSKKNINKEINLINKTSLCEAVAILDNAECYIGPEGGLMNMCGLTDTPMVISYTNMSPKTRMPYRHNELGWEVYPVIPDVECRFCISNTSHSITTINIMKNCLFDDFKCVDEITFNKFKMQLDKIV